MPNDRRHEILEGIKNLYERGHNSNSVVSEVLDSNEAMYIEQSSITHEVYGDRYPEARDGLVAEIDAGGKVFLLLDSRDDSSSEGDFQIVGVGPQGELEGAPLDIQQNTRVIVGRRHHKDRFRYLPTVSREHFAVEYAGGNLSVRNMESTNRTIVTARKATPIEPESDSGDYGRAVDGIRTVLGSDRLQGDEDFGEEDSTAPYGYYKQLPILGRHSPSINGGVYLGGSGREAIVVDGGSDIIESVLIDTDNLVELPDPEHKFSSAELLCAVMNRVQDRMPYDEIKAEEISRDFYGDELVDLSTYIIQQAGVCRHQALFAACLTERLIASGSLRGRAAIERNQIPGFGAHAWAVFRPTDGEPVIIDPTNSFIGTKNQALSVGRWDYALSTD